MSREYQHGVFSIYPPDDDQQTAICTSDPECKAAADEHNPDCPIEEQLKADIGF